MRRALARATGASVVASVTLATACAHAPRTSHAGSDPPPCATLDAAQCARARALALAASTYADEAHDYVLAQEGIASGAALARTNEGWRALPSACARAKPRAPALDVDVIDYAFVGVVVDGSLVSADADVAPFLASAPPDGHEASLVAMALVHDRAPPELDRGPALVEAPSGACTCEGATHVAGAPRYGALVAYSFRAERPGGWLSRGDVHVRAIDLVVAALGDPHRSVRESRIGGLAIDGLDRTLAGGAKGPLAFRVTDPQRIAYVAAPLAELCDFPAPEVSPSPLDFGVAPYGTAVERTVHVVNHAPTALRALLGASTFVLPARGTLDLPLRWTPQGDAPGCETQTRDEAIPFLRPNGTTARAARVLETVRTGRATVSRTEHVEPSPPKLDLDSAARDWSCPHDFVRTDCHAESTGTYAVVAEPRGDDSCHFACRGPSAPGRHPLCRYDATLDCALHCAP